MSGIYGLPFQPLPPAIKGTIGASVLLFVLTLGLMGAGIGTHIQGYSDAAIGTIDATFIGAVIGGVLLYKREHALVNHLHMLFKKQRIISANNIRRTLKASEAITRELFNQLGEKLHERRENARNELKRIGIKNNFDATLYQAQVTEKEKYGNCAEMSMLAFRDLIALFPNLNVKVDVFNLEPGDHVFVVIGRKIGSDPASYKTWGEEAVIYDPWASEEGAPVYYPAVELEKQLKDARYSPKEPTPYDRVPLVPVDLSFQKLDLLVTNIFAPNEFQGSDALRADLVEFHSSGANKVTLAQVIYKKAHSSDNVQDLALAAQMNHFLKGQGLQVEVALQEKQDAAIPLPLQETPLSPTPLPFLEEPDSLPQEPPRYHSVFDPSVES